MPRRGETQKRASVPDPKYGDVLVTRFINVLMRQGKKSTAQRIFYGSMELLQQRSGEDPITLFKKAVQHARPMLEVRSRRVGGSTYQVPHPVRDTRQLALACRWLVGFARQRGEKSMAERLAGELMDAAHGRGATLKKKEDVHKMAEANKAFAHYRW